MASTVEWARADRKFEYGQEKLIVDAQVVVGDKRFYITGLEVRLSSREVWCNSIGQHHTVRVANARTGKRIDIRTVKHQTWRAMREAVVEWVKDTEG